VGKEGKGLNHKESDEQINLFEWAKLMQGQHPELALLHAIPNGGKRDAREAARLKREGVLAGVSDVFLPVAKGGFHGLYIELKAKGGHVSPAQWKWLRETTTQGYYSIVCFGWVEASEVIKGYLEGRK
jgi:hypothetical protein